MSIRFGDVWKSVAVTVAIALTTLLAGCGGGGEGAPPQLPMMIDSLGREVPEADFGGGDPDVAGVDGLAIDGGAQIFNGEVALVDNAGNTRTTVTGADGYYRINVKGLTPPFVVKVVRPGGLHWFAGSVAPVKPRRFVTIHLTGLADKTLSLVADSTGVGGIAASVTPALLAAKGDSLLVAKTKVRSSLAVALINAGLDPASYDPIASPLRAGSSDKHGLFLQRLTIEKGEGDQGRTVVMGTLAGAGGYLLDGPAATATFNQPAGVALDSAGNLYVADTANNVIRKITPDGVVATFSGNGVANYANGDRATSAFRAPSGVAVDPAGNVYVADSGNYVIRKIRPDGSATTLAGAGVAGHLDAAGTAARFFNPRSVAVDGAGNVYVGDSTAAASSLTPLDVVRKVTPQGIVTTISVRPSGGPEVPVRARAVAVDPAGTLFVGCGSYPGGICRITAAGQQSMLIGPGGTTIGDPDGLAVDTAGNVYLASDFQIRKLTAGGELVKLARTLTREGAIAVDSVGDLFLASAGSNSIRKVTQAGAVSTFAGSAMVGSTNGPAAAATFAQPTAIAVDAAGAMYIADTGNHAIRKIARTGVVTTVAGTGSPGFADATGTAASFNTPTGVAVDGGGNLYVADSGNNRVRRITPAGDVSTLAGSGVARYVDGTGTAASFSAPTHVAVDGAGNVFVSDVGNASVRKVTPAGVVSTVAGLGRIPTRAEYEAQHFVGVGALVVDRSGAVTFEGRCDYFRDMLLPVYCIFTISAQGQIDNGRWGVNNEWRRPGMAVDAAGNLYYALSFVGKDGSELQRRIFKLTPQGVETESAFEPSLEFNALAGLAFDAEGALLAVDTRRSAVRIFLP